MFFAANSKHTALVVAAHPDDEVLGCGGTMALLAKKGFDVHTLILAEGLTSRDDGALPEDLSGLKKTAVEANAVLGVERVSFESLPDNRMDSLDLLDVVKKIEAKIEEVRPETILTHFAGDLNVDHQITHQAVLTAARPQPGTIVKNILQFEVPSATDWVNPESDVFRPCFFQNIEPTLSQKLEALKIYSSEMRDWPHSRSLENVENLARWRGGSCGCTAAEAFMITRVLSDA